MAGCICHLVKKLFPDEKGAMFWKQKGNGLLSSCKVCNLEIWMSEERFEVLIKRMGN